MSKLHLNLKPSKPRLMLVGLVSLVLAGCVQIDFVRDYPLAGYPSYSTSGGGGGYYPYSYYSGGLYPGGYGGYYGNGYLRGYYPGGYSAGAYYPYSRGLNYAGDCYSPFPDSYFDRNNLRYGCPYPAYSGGYAGPLAPRVFVPPVLQPDEPGPRPKAPRGRNGGPIKLHRDVERPAALVDRSSAAARSPAAPVPPARMIPAAPASADTGGRAVNSGGRAAIQGPVVRAPVPVAPSPAAAPRVEPGSRGGLIERGPGLRAR